MTFAYNLEIDSVENVIKEIEYGRQNKQKLGWSGEVTYNDTSDLTIDTLDILRALEKYEVKLGSVYQPEKYEDYFYIGDYIENIFRDFTETRSDNTYNYNQPLSNHLDIRLFTTENSEWIVYAVKVHLYGDIRGCYSPWMVFSLYDYELLEAFNETDKTINIEVDGWTGYASVEAESNGEIYVRVEKDGEEIEFNSYAYDLEEVKEEIRGEIEKL